MAMEFLGFLLAAWVLQAWFRPASFGEDIAKIVRGYREAMQKDPTQ
ncbi:MAG: hypothetical protein P0Y66_22365 [Candidatus Kaistia colombiensis]|nr:MAG: hypothetical protein P0Y66_22365 [Kaistia sp.]